MRAPPSAWRRFLRDRVSVGALIVLVIIAGVSAAAPLIARTDPDRFSRTPEGRIATLQPPGPN
jgi:hypothetical protein